MTNPTLAAPRQMMATYPIMSPEEVEAVCDPRNPLCPFHTYRGNQGAVRTAILIGKAAFNARVDMGKAVGWHTEVMACSREFPARILLTGPKSVGKTTFARSYSRLVGTDYKTGIMTMPYAEIDGTNIKRAEQILEKMQQAYREAGLPMIPTETKGSIRIYRPGPGNLFIDEVHRLPMSVQERMLKMSEKSDGIFEVGNMRVDCRRMTILLATTKHGKLDRAYLSRFPIKIALAAHSLEDLATIIQDANADWTRETAMRLARLKPVPREALDIASLVNAARVSENCSTEKALGIVADNLGLVDGCINQKAIDVLMALSADENGLSKKNLCSSCEMDETEFEQEIVPQLLRNQFHPSLITVSSRHKITEAGLDELRKRGLIDY